MYTVYTYTYRVGQKRVYTPYMTVCMVISLLKIPYVHRIYIYIYGWPEACIYTVYDRMYGDFPA